MLLDAAHRGRKISVKTMFHFFWSSAENTAGSTFFWCSTCMTPGVSREKTGVATTYMPVMKPETLAGVSARPAVCRICATP